MNSRFYQCMRSTHQTTHISRKYLPLHPWSMQPIRPSFPKLNPTLLPSMMPYRQRTNIYMVLHTRQWSISTAWHSQIHVSSRPALINTGPTNLHPRPVFGTTQPLHHAAVVALYMHMGYSCITGLLQIQPHQ